MNNNYTPGQGCQCHAHSEEECGCDADWTPKEVYELREQRDRLHGEREFFQSAFNEQGDVLSKVIEQRDRLADALRQIDEARLDDFIGPHDMALKCVLIAREALTAVKGGSDE